MVLRVHIETSDRTVLAAIATAVADTPAATRNGAASRIRRSAAMQAPMSPRLTMKRAEQATVTNIDALSDPLVKRGHAPGAEGRG
jgi:hypothetical protein